MKSNKQMLDEIEEMYKETFAVLNKLINKIAEIDKNIEVLAKQKENLQGILTDINSYILSNK